MTNTIRICAAKGEKVKAGQPIGFSGSTGNATTGSAATGPYLHFAVRRDG